MVSGGTIMILGGTQAVFFTALLLSKKGKNTSDLYLVAYLLLLTLHLAYYFFMFFNNEAVPTVLGILGFSLVILHTPIFFLYVRSLAIDRQISAKTIVLHTLPYLIYNAILIGAYFMGVLELQPYKGFLGITSTDYPIFYQGGQVLAIVTVAYLTWGFYLLRTFRTNVNQRLSNLVSYKWLSFLVVSFLFYFILIYLVIYIASVGGFITIDTVFYYVSFIIMAYVFILGFFGIRYASLFADETTSVLTQKTESKYAKSGLTTETIQEIQEKLSNAMMTEQKFLNPDITLTSLSAELDLASTYVSQVINQQFKLNFYDFVNQYRVEEVKRRLTAPEHSHLSVLGIALDCGFKSKSSFNKSFKKHTGKTPSDFKRSA